MSRRRNGKPFNRKMEGDQPIMTKRERRSANRMVLAFAVLVSGFLVAHFTHLLWESSLNLVVYIPEDNLRARLWVDGLRRSGLHVHVISENNAAQCSYSLRIPKELRTEVCAVTVNTSRYVLSGYVSADTISRLLSEHPSYLGLALVESPSGIANRPTLKSSSIWGFWEDGHKELYPSSAPTA